MYVSGRGDRQGFGVGKVVGRNPAGHPFADD